MSKAPWGEVPPLVRELIDSLRRSISEHAKTLEHVEWPTQPGDISPALLATLAETERVFEASKDLRSLLTAYAHQIHEPRPKMADVARSQNASPQAVTTRYSAKTMAALVELLSHETEIAEAFENSIIKQGFPSLTHVGAIDMPRIIGDTVVDVSSLISDPLHSRSVASGDSSAVSEGKPTPNRVASTAKSGEL